MTHTQTVMLRLLTMCIPFRNLRKKWRTFLRDFLSDYDRDARRSMRAWRRHPVAGRTILILEPNYCHGEVIPGFCRHLLDMGYRVDVLMHHSLARQSPLCCFKEGDIHIFTAMCTSWKRLAKARVLTRYEAILVSTSAFYDIPGWASFLHMTGFDKFANLLAVEHELKDIPRFGEEELDRQGRLLTLGSFPRGMMVNPHFFGEIPPAPRNREPVFITVGSLSAQRKNHELLVEALETVCNEGYRNFSVIIVGEGELGEIPGHLRPFLHVAGKLDFPAMYEAMRRADYFLPLLDPGNPAHDRYITTGITGSALLIYGFAKIPVIHEKFASFYGFNDRNALLYGEETLGGAMLRAIRQTEEEFRQLFQNGNKDRYSPLAYARLMAGSLFPQYGRIVYLDADVLLAGDVAELYFSDLRGASVAAAGDGLALWSIEKGTMHPHLEYMGNYLSSPLSYCNSGVLVLDLDQMRRRNLEHRLLQWLRSRPEPFPYPDQDILNIALHGDITPLPPEWNFQFLSWTWDEERTRLLRGTEFENVPSISCGRSWKLLHMVGPEKPWRLPDAPGTLGQFHWILYSFFWWPEAKKLPAFRKELDAISQGLAPLLRRHIRGQQWKLFFSRGHIFRKRRDKIRWLKKLLSILDGRKP